VYDAAFLQRAWRQIKYYLYLRKEIEIGLIKIKKQRKLPQWALMILEYSTLSC
jgi:hypothetical protein